jgi:hypothetical protein
MQRRPDHLRVLLAVVVLAFSQGCGSCVGEATPTEKKDPPSVAAQPRVTDPRFLKTRAKDIALTLDATPDESLIPDGGAVLAP